MSNVRHFSIKMEKKNKCLSNTKKIGNQCVKKHRPASLLPVCIRVLGRILSSFMFSYLMESNLILETQSGFNPGDFCVHQFLAITHEIFSSFFEYAKLQRCSLTFQKLSIKCSIRKIFIKLNATRSQKIYRPI